MVNEKLIKEDGQPSFGLFPGGIHDINHMDYELRNSMDRKLGKFAKYFKFNQFQFVGFTSPELIVGIAIVDLKFASNCFIYAYEPKTKRFEEFSFIQPLAINTQIGLQPNNSKATFCKGQNKISINASETTRLRSVSVSLKSGFKVEALIDESIKFNPLALCSRAGYTGWVYTQKSTARQCSGSVIWADKKYDLENIAALASVDWSAGYMRRETSWNWASLSCHLPDSRRFGFNLAAGVNETGFTENALWLDDTLHKVDMVDFQFNRFNAKEAWLLRSNDGAITLCFEPAGQRKEKMNLIFAASNFSQHFGKFYGDISINNETIQLADCWGFVEDHYAKW